MEYRLEKIHVADRADRSAHIVQRLNEYAAEGWRVVSIDLRIHPAFAVEDLPVLLERKRT
ncbi:hypothetical protein FZC33_16075 [Labrys sp. KNU-23]|uniref:hypothetical protein n=1 Tax=Labrys sp. KNU-23 TaxID=2789216 RepID=UPI0011EBC083|nr:hypothetical protein [Labrys sp. KNU-23]QEN87739.1 hypothetical protein FZC33_16075 [Labrys sp. KNU-23]